jgi:hypothetical protein
VLYRYDAFFLRNSTTNGIANMTSGYGNLTGDIPEENTPFANQKIIQLLLCVAALRLFI